MTNRTTNYLSFRLADEVEQRTDVRKSGMEGFYANLLTKNVAMGGDVDAHAVSVYTAGSARQSHVLHEPVPAPVEKKSLKFDHHAASSSSARSDRVQDEEEEQEVVDPSESSRYVDHSKKGLINTSDTRHSHETNEPVHKAPRSDNAKPVVESKDTQSVATTAVHGISTVEAVPTPALAPIADKKDQILSAKDRYLARKRALEG